MYQSHYENVNVDVSGELEKYRELREKIRPMVIIVNWLVEIMDFIVVHFIRFRSQMEFIFYMIWYILPSQKQFLWKELMRQCLISISVSWVDGIIYSGFW